MAPIFKPTKDKEFFTPFGPVMGYFKMPAAFVEQMNAAMSEQLADHSDHLVGKVRQELRFDQDLINLAAANVGQTLVEYHAFAKKRNSLGEYDPSTKQYGLDIVSGWFVRQFENEYNPLHIHTGCTISCVGYLKLPDGIEQEWEEDYQDHHPSHAHIQFAHGTDAAYSFTNFMAKPQVGDFYIFPSHMFHCVYPFRTVGERRSFSMNVTVEESEASAGPA
ncbi:putative 2OG-Fe(II) oxygenase [Hyphococcus flavus]|uniref:2OG-Fe(II) oxygenase n=1 Tax=Hyphococcus flavus TaxID=1866326 RepID=A0AAF0CGM8_9PROT|nr:putative 2OG-Fe(II) oxygenase [Hyphococcus flavus]WDI32368.1 putative 2OG-Fe(II) oxygenase [Hyphococcus flavus]